MGNIMNHLGLVGHIGTSVSIRVSIADGMRSDTGSHGIKSIVRYPVPGIGSSGGHPSAEGHRRIIDRRHVTRDRPRRLSAIAVIDRVVEAVDADDVVHVQVGRHHEADLRQGPPEP